MIKITREKSFVGTAGVGDVVSLDPADERYLVETGQAVYVEASEPAPEPEPELPPEEKEKPDPPSEAERQPAPKPASAQKPRQKPRAPSAKGGK